MLPWDGYVELLFRTTPEGRVLYPYGALWRGYVVDEASERLVRAWHSRVAPLVAALVVFAVLVLNILPVPWNLVLALLPFAALDLAWRRFTARLRPGWRRGVTPAKPAEWMAAYARAMPLSQLVILAGASALGMLAGLAVAILSWDAPNGERWIGLGATAFAGASGGLAVLVMRLRRG